MKHLLSLEKLSRVEMETLLQSAAVFKRERGITPDFRSPARRGR